MGKMSGVAEEMAGAVAVADRGGWSGSSQVLGNTSDSCAIVGETDQESNL